MRGIKPQPANVLKSKNDKMKINNKTLESRKENEPKIKSNKLRCPKHLSVEAKKEWRKVIRLYNEFQDPILCDLDLNVLQVYCEAVVRYNKAMEKVSLSSEVISINNTAKQNPWLRVANDAADVMRKTGELLLLDPISRARAGLAKARKEKDPDDYLFG